MTHVKALHWQRERVSFAKPGTGVAHYCQRTGTALAPHWHRRNLRIHSAEYIASGQHNSQRDAPSYRLVSLDRQPETHIGGAPGGIVSVDFLVAAIQRVFQPTIDLELGIQGITGIHVEQQY